MLIGRSLILSGVRVRLRLPHTSDAATLRATAERLGARIDDLTIERVVRHDPRRRAAVVACAWLGGTELVAGFATAPVATGEPDVLVADEDGVPGLSALLATTLRERAAA